MKPSSKFLAGLLILGFLYSFYRLFSGRGGSGLGDFIDGLSYTSIILFIASLTIIVFNFKRLKKYGDTFLFLLLGLPITVMAATGIIRNITYNRTPDLTPKYPRPISSNIFSEDSLRIEIQIDSLIALTNRSTGRLKIADAFIDTIIYSQTGRQVFVSYIQIFEQNDSGNDLSPGYLTADKRDSIYWHLREGSPNNVMMSGNYHDLETLRLELRKFYFNQYTFNDADSLKDNFFWEINSK